MPIIYKTPSCDDLFGIASFGGGDGGQGRKGRLKNYDKNRPKSSWDFNGNGSVLDEAAVVTGVTALATGGATALIAGIATVGLGYAHASGH